MTSLNRIFVITIACLALVITGCKPSNRVTFKPALVSIDVGPGWVVQNVPIRELACTPRLMGKAGMINGLLLEGEISDMKAAADKMQTALLSTSKAAPDSFKQQNFTTDSGQAGIHLSYAAKSDKGELRSHNFITNNRRGQFVSISYITSPDVESPEVMAAIQKTLQAE